MSATSSISDSEGEDRQSVGLGEEQEDEYQPGDYHDASGIARAQMNTSTMRKYNVQQQILATDVFDDTR